MISTQFVEMPATNNNPFQFYLRLDDHTRRHVFLCVLQSNIQRGFNEVTLINSTSCHSFRLNPTPFKILSRSRWLELKFFVYRPYFVIFCFSSRIPPINISKCRSLQTFFIPQPDIKISGIPHPLLH